MPRHIVVDNIPYEYAVPKLTGWNVGDTASDQHVKSSHLTSRYPPIADQGIRYIQHEGPIGSTRQGHLAGLRI